MPRILGRGLGQEWAVPAHGSPDCLDGNINIETLIPPRPKRSAAQMSKGSGV